MNLKSMVVAGVILTGGLFGPITTVRASVLAPPDPGGSNSAPSYETLDSWLFLDSTNWTSDKGYPPASFTNLAYSYLGDGASLVVDTNLSAWLQFNIVETNGATNFSPSVGTVCFWFAPSSWSSTNAGGVGPGEYGRLFEAGSYTTNSSFGLWSLYVDDTGANLYFSTQTNDLSGTLTTYLSAPIAWKTNYFHFVALTYSPTNTALYLDGGLVTNGPGLSVYPGPEVTTFTIGADSNGLYQAHGSFNDVETYAVPLDSDTIQEMFDGEFPYYLMNPWNAAMFTIIPAGSYPSTGPTPDVITGAGYLEYVGSADPHYSTNADIVWITNITATAVDADTENVTFTVQGGQAGYFYDVFATGALESPMSKGVWFWMGQGQSGGTYTLPITSDNAFLILGTPVDSDSDGLTDAYELLVSHTDPNNPSSNADGILDGWEILLGLNPQVSNFTSPSERSNYGYTGADWLNTVSGVRSGQITTDNEGNVQTVSQ